MQDVHTWMRLGLSPTIARILWMLGFQRRLVRRCEWLMLIPKDGRLPHTSQTAAIVQTPHYVGPVRVQRCAGVPCQGGFKPVSQVSIPGR